MMLWQLVRARFWELRGFKRKAGGIRAARSRRLNEEAKKSGAVVVVDLAKEFGDGALTSKTATPPLSVLESVADQKSGGAA